MLRMKCLNIVFVLLTLTVQVASASVSVRINGGLLDTGVRPRMESQVSDLLSAINSAYDSGSAPHLADMGLGGSIQRQIGNLWKYAAFHCLDNNQVRACINTYDGYQIRDIRVEFALDDGTFEYQEGIVNFDRQGNIVSFRLALASHMVGEMLETNDTVHDIRRRRLILDYLERFRTAYNEKDIEFLNQVYSDDALIIVGQVIEAVVDNMKMKDYVYVTRTKQEYIARLSDVFRRNRKIHVAFDKVKVLLHPAQADYYGVLLHQAYTSDTYHDDGYLFLFWDFRDERHPMIHVRRWEPYEILKVADGTEADVLDDFIADIRFN